MVCKLAVLRFRKRIRLLYLSGHISRNERDVAFKILDSSLVEVLDEPTLLVVLERVISYYPLSYYVGVKDSEQLSFGGIQL